MKRSKLSVIAIMLAATLSLGALSGCDTTKKEEGTGTPSTESAKTEGTEGTPSTESAPPADAPARDNIVIATENETPSLTTYDHNAVAGDYMNKLTHNGLMRVDADLNPVPDLAESVEIDPTDNKKWNVVLKQGVKFHDGTDMTAEDVKASLDFVREAPKVAQYSTTVIQVDIVDDYNLVLHTAEPAATVLTDLTHHGNFIMPKEMLDNGDDLNANPIGTGPYKFVNWTFGDKVEFEMFEDYFDKDNYPSIKHMTWQIIPEGSSRTIALETGTADVIIELATPDIPRLEENKDIEVILKPGTSYNWLMVNLEKAPFDNELFRKAIDTAIDKQTVIDVALDGLAEQAYAMSPVNAFAGDSVEEVNTYDVELAKKYLEESGIDPSTAGFSVICSNDQKQRCAEVIQSDLLKLGIDMKIERMDLATYLEVTAQGDYVASIGGYTSNSMLGYLLGVYHSISIGGSNKTRLNDPKVDELISKAAATMDAKEREAILVEVNTYLNTITPQIPLYQDSVKRAYNNKLGGLEVNAGGTLYFNNVYWTE